MQLSTWLPAMKAKRPMSQRMLTRLLTGLLVVILAWISGRMVWMWLAPPDSVATWQPKSVTVNTSSPDVNVGKLLSMNLFGQYNAKPKPVTTTPVKKDAPETRLNVKLVGVVASTNAKNALAVITQSGKQNTYGIGEVIEGTRATLKAVYNDRVIIGNNGRDETVMLEGLKFSTQRTATSSPQQSTTTSSSKKGGDAGKLSEIKQKILAQPQSLFSYIRLSQVKKDGAITGFRVNPGKDRLLFDSVGLKANDLAVGINGNSLTDPSVMAKLWAELSSATDFTLTVERDGQVHDIHIELQ